MCVCVCAVNSGVAPGLRSMYTQDEWEEKPLRRYDG